MKKLVVALTVVGVLAGPAAGMASAASNCSLMEKLGIVQNVKECEDPPQ